MLIPNSSFSIMVVDDDKIFHRLIKTIFTEDNYVIHTADSGEASLELLGRLQIDVVVIDLRLPGIDGMTLLKEIKADYPDIMTIMITGQGNIQLAVEAVKNGADDFLQKPFPSEELRMRIDKLHQMWLLREENKNLKLEMKFDYDSLIGSSSPMLQLKNMILRVAPTDTSILIQGETGTGKELVARAIHHHSRRMNRPFIVVDCAAISSTIIESELFGHVKGSFTGASNPVKGLVRNADSGTLFFDEIGELDLSVQSRLLRMLQEREVRPLGSSISFPVDIRILAATNRNLMTEMEQGRFREDLFYRIQVITVKVPPLRTHKEDIPLLTAFFLKQTGLPLSEGSGISKKALDMLSNYRWPGNVRELQNAILRAVTLRKQDTLIPEDFPDYYSSENYLENNENSDIVSNDICLADYEKNAIINALKLCGNNRRRAAEKLNIGEATLYRKIKKYKINDIQD